MHLHKLYCTMNIQILVVSAIFEKTNALDNYIFYKYQIRLTDRIIVV